MLSNDRNRAAEEDGYQSFLFTKEYPVIPFEHVVEVTETYVRVHTLPHLCCGVAVDQYKTFTVEGNCLTITNRIQNVGEKEISATEFCHNFFQFDGREVDEKYKLEFPYTVSTRIRRGELHVERDSIRLGAFDKATSSTAFWVNGYEGLRSHWMKLSHEETGTSVLIEDQFPVCRFYSWNNEAAVCPETFADIHLKPDEMLTYSRKYYFFDE